MAEINIKYYIFKPANHFYFLYNISKWHFSCRKPIYEYWPKLTGKYTKEEKEALKLFKGIIKKHKFKLWSIFRYPTYNNVNKRISESTLLSSIEKKNLKKILKITQIRFDEVWKTEESNLKNWYPEISVYSKDEAIAKDLETFFGHSKYKKVNVLLLMGGDRDGGGGGANIGSNWVEQEIGIKNTSLTPIKNVLWHEITHLLFTNRKNKVIKEYLKDNKIQKEITSLGRDGSDVQFIYETVTATLFPRGILAEKHFNRKNRKTINNSDIKKILEIGPDPHIAEKFIIAKYYKQFEDYFKKGLKFDEEYIRIIHRGYLEYLEIFKK